MRSSWLTCLCTAVVLFIILDAAGAQTKPLTFGGRIVDAKGDPLAGVKVTLYQMTYGNTPYTHQVTLVEEKETGTDGTYTFAVSRNSENYREGSVIARKEGLALGWIAWRMQDNEPQRGDMTLGEPKELSGTVGDETGKAVAGADVGIALAVVGDPEKDRRYMTYRIAPHLLTAKTDENGRFAFPNMPAEATFEFVVRKPGRATVCTLPASFRGDKCQFSPGQTGIKLATPPEAKVEGVVVEKAGDKPVAGVAIMILVESLQFILPPEPVVSARDGSFRIGGLPAGSYPVQLVPAQKGTAEWIAEPVNVSLEAAQTKSGVKLELTKGGIIEVRVKESVSGKPLEKASVSIHDSQRDQWVGHQTDPNGLARVRVVPGSYEISGAYKQGYTRQRQQEQQQVEVADGETKRFECTLTAAPRVTGTVRDEAGKPLEGVVLAIKPNSPEEKTSDSDGKFEASWDPSDWGPENTTFVLMARDVTRNLGAVVDIDEQTENLDIRLQPGVVFTGKVLNHEGKPLAGARLQVMLRVSNWRSTIDGLRGERKQTSGEDGTFEIKAIPPQRQYQVTAMAEGYGTHSVEVDAYDAKNGRMELGAFKLPLADLSVTGIVVDANDKPVAGAYIYAYGPNQPERYRIQTDSQGKFVLQNVCAGSIQLNANVGGSGRLYGYVMTEGGATDVKIVVSEGSSGRAYVPRKPQPLVGKPLPELKSAGVELPADANDRMLLVCLWDMNQRPSRHCLAQLARQAAQLSEKGVVVVALQAAKAEESALNQWVQDNKPPFKVGKFAGEVEKTRFAWGAVSLPHLILTDKKHIVVAEGFNAGELDARIQTAAGPSRR